MLHGTHIKQANEFEYATASDFCRIFGQDMKSLFLLALLLTGEEEKAEKCFLDALENATNRRTVFKDWARSWARRAIIQAAQGILNPRPGPAVEVLTTASDAINTKASAEHIEISAVLGLEHFDRFVFVMSVLEKYSYHECAILLGTTPKEVIEARNRALERLGREVESAFDNNRAHGGTADEKPALDFRAFARSA